MFHIILRTIKALKSKQAITYHCLTSYVMLVGSYLEWYVQTWSPGNKDKNC